MHTYEIEYQGEDTMCRGFVAYDPTGSDHRPCVLVAHDWRGRGPDVCEKAMQLAKLGYVAFAIDLYGGARTGHTTEEKRALLYPIMGDRPKVAARMLAALNTAKTLPLVDATKIAAIGYCFGGLCVLDLARIGADVKGVVSIHGLLSAPSPACSAAIRAKILVLHGYEDPMATPEHVRVFAEEMTTRKADWQIHMYGHTKHSFTNPKANDAELGLHYNAVADRRSWESLTLFLNGVWQGSPLINT